MRHGDLTLKLQHDARKTRELCHPCAACRVAERLSALEEFRHAQGRAHFHLRMGDCCASVAEPVGCSGWNGDRLTRLRQQRLASQAESHLASDNREAFLLRRVGVARGNVATRRQVEIEGEQLTIGLGAALANHDALSAYGIHDLAPCAIGLRRVDHMLMTLKCDARWFGLSEA